MSSQVSGDIELIKAGPCKLTYRGVALGHTRDGCLITIKLLTRDRKVDEYAEQAVDTIHNRAEITVKVKFVEKSPEVLAALFPFGVVTTDGRGIGRVPGSRGSDVSGSLVIHPLEGDESADDVVLHDAIVSDQRDMQNDLDSDREFDATFVSIVDAGQLFTLGTLGVVNEPTPFLLSDGSEFVLSDGSVFVLG